MASHTKIFFAAEKAHLVMIEDEPIVSNPKEDEKKFKIWLDQVFIPFYIQEKTHVFMGPIEHPQHVLDAPFKEFFPSTEEENILAFKDLIRVYFIEGISNVFRGTQLSNKDQWLSWSYHCKSIISLSQPSSEKDDLGDNSQSAQSDYSKKRFSDISYEQVHRRTLNLISSTKDLLDSISKDSTIENQILALLEEIKKLKNLLLPDQVRIKESTLHEKINVEKTLFDRAENALNLSDESLIGLKEEAQVLTRKLAEVNQNIVKLEQVEKKKDISVGIKIMIINVTRLAEKIEDFEK
ncbi:hypothetical protein RJT34_16989 [Clitoria ternatea]|uniref:Uncharacterized protein n=1 Tax=Clitoria ternatea TaxID=43366 RepID=A0AAN9J9Q8_CLITE